jgi:glycosyltransferase involved in cell wall biosynthesis
VVAGYELVATFAAVVAGKLARRPVVGQFHVSLGWMLPQFNRVRRTLFEVASRLVHPQLVRSTAVSAEAARDAYRYGVRPGTIEVVRNAVNTERIDGLAGEEPAIQVRGDLPLVLAVGRLARQKGFDLLLEAHGQVLAAGTSHQLVIVGEGSERARLGILCEELGVTQTAVFAGRLANPYSLMARADLFCLSSRHEGLPLVLLEALALGCPVLATDCAEGVRVALADGRRGQLVGVDSAEIAAAIAAHLCDPAELRRRAVSAAVEIRRDYSLDGVAEAFSGVFAAAAR